MQNHQHNPVSGILSPDSNTGKQPDDFQRDVYCLFGLPVDNLTIASTKETIRRLTRERNNLVLSTININWVVQSIANPAFRAAILKSDLVTLDGKPLVWLGKLTGLPMRETVAGSTLIEELRDEQSDRPLTIFLFGGEGNIANLAKESLNKQSKSGLQCVGALNPGFGSIEEMSSSRIIDIINQADPDILLVALGAAKGVEWIERNRSRLNTGLISHLGATINFLAGTIHRAPKMMRDWGLEWLWRIFQEPKLFFRYSCDGLILAKMLFARLPDWLNYQRRNSHYGSCFEDNLSNLQESEESVTLIFGPGPATGQNSILRTHLRRIANCHKNIVLDFSSTSFIDSAFVGLLLLLIKKQQQHEKSISMINTDRQIKSVFRLFCLDVSGQKGKP